MSDNHNSAGGVPTTGHVWDDDLGDFTNQPPKWWMLGLTASAIWVVVYWLMYPAIPVSVGAYHFKGIGLPGTGQWTAIKELAEDQKELDAVRGQYEDKLKDMTPAAILADADLSKYVERSARVLFSDNCAACHGQNGAGAVITNTKVPANARGLMAPVLNDEDWLHGGTIDKIYETITKGRGDGTDGGAGMMMAHEGMLSDAEIDTLAAAVAKGEPNSTPLFKEKNCVSCHGDDGKGKQEMGSANLTDKAYRFADVKNADGTLGLSVDSIKQTIKYGVGNNGNANARVAIMPNFTAAGKLSAVEMKKLAVYVYNIGGPAAHARDEAPAAPAAKAKSKAKAK